MSPILVPDGVFPFNEVRQLFIKDSKEIDKKVTDFVINKLEKYSE